MEDKKMTTKKALLVLGGLLLVVGLSVVVPAKWLGVKPVVSNRTQTDFTVRTNSNSNITNNSSSWKDLAVTSLDPVDVKELERQTPDPKVIAELNDPNNLTSSFSKNLYVTSTYLAKNPVDDASKQKILDKLIADEAAKIVPTVYSYKDLNVVKTESKDSIRKYGNDLATVLDTLISGQSIAENLACIQNYINSKDEKDLKILINDHKKVDAKLKKLIAMPVPLSAVSYHLLTVNRVAAYRDALYNLSLAASDPMRATLLVEKYPDIAVGVLRAYNELMHYFDFQNIVFTSKEPGYVFIIGYTSE